MEALFEAIPLEELPFAEEPLEDALEAPPFEALLDAIPLEELPLEEEPLEDDPLAEEPLDEDPFEELFDDDLAAPLEALFELPPFDEPFEEAPLDELLLAAFFAVAMILKFNG